MYRLDADGAAVRESGPDRLDEVAVIVPGDPARQVQVNEGERHLRALPPTFTGTRCRAVLITAQDKKSQTGSGR